MANTKQPMESQHNEVLPLCGVSISVCSCYPNYPDDDLYACMGCGLPLLE